MLIIENMKASRLPDTPSLLVYILEISFQLAALVSLSLDQLKPMGLMLPSTNLPKFCSLSKSMWASFVSDSMDAQLS